MPETTGTVRTIPTRRMAFEESLADLPRHFAAGCDLISCHLIASLSTVFPPGEEFFVRSVRGFRDQVTDPELKRQVAGFIGQEAMHGRAHRAFNERLADLGYPTRFFERLTDKGLRLREKLLPPISNLALTAALEHFTATLAELVLTDEELREDLGHDSVRNLFMWHALEESEHKAVAFDVFRAVGGSERLRIWTMRFIMIGFVIGMTLQVLISMLFDRDTYRPGTLRRSLKEWRGSPLTSRNLRRKLRDYNRRGFHPDDYDTTELEREWRDRLFGAEGTLNGLLVGSATAGPASVPAA